MTFTICHVWICLLNTVCFLVLKKITQKERNLSATTESGKGWTGGKRFHSPLQCPQEKRNSRAQRESDDRQEEDMKARWIPGAGEERTKWAWGREDTSAWRRALARVTCGQSFILRVWVLIVEITKNTLVLLLSGCQASTLLQNKV